MYSIPKLYVCVCFSKERMGSCPALLKRVCYVQYNLPHPLLKVTMAFDGVVVCLCFRIHFPLPCVCVCLFLKKRMGNCPTLFKRVCCVQYNLHHPSPLKVTMAFEWSYGMLLCQNPFPSPLYVCVCLFLKKEKEKKEWVIVPHYLRKCVMCCVLYNLLYSPLKVTMPFEWSYGVPLYQNRFPFSLCVYVCF